MNGLGITRHFLCSRCGGTVAVSGFPRSMMDDVELAASTNQPG